MHAPTAPLLFTPSFKLPDWWRAARQASPLLSLYAATVAWLMLPVLLALWLDPRELRGVPLWLKPLKFMASISLFAWTTALCMSLLPAEQRAQRSLRRMEWLIVLVGGAELLYIGGRALLGEASHFNFSSMTSSLLYSLMGIGALLLTGTQGFLAWRLRQAGPQPGGSVSWYITVVWGLALTAVLNAIAGAALGSFQPPAGMGMPVLGWHWGGGDLRPAHFFGLHAQQLFLLAGAWLARHSEAKAMRQLRRFAIGYVVIWLLLMANGLRGATLTVPALFT